jgi:HTH-type transcriptional regulator/antitoxin HipB
MQISNTEDLGHLIRKVRKQQGLTQEALAGASGVGPRFIIELEKGKPRCEVGKVLLVLQMLGVNLNVDAPDHRS